MKRFLLFIILPLLVSVFCVGCGNNTPELIIPPGIAKITDKSFPNYSRPIWSPSGMQLVVTDASWSKLKSDLYIVDLESGDYEKFIETDGIVLPHDWSPDGSQIVLSTWGSTYKEGIWLFNLNNESPVYLGPGDAAAWSPDGKQLAIYTCEQEKDVGKRSANIYLLDLSTKEKKELFSSAPCERSAYLDWSPDGKTLAFSYIPFTNEETPPDQIFLMDIASGLTKSITEDGNWSPSWSPDGRSIALVRNYKLAISDNIGSCVKEIEEIKLKIGQVSWSPDGTKWVVPDMGDIYIIDIPTVMGEDFLKNGIACP